MPNADGKLKKFIVSKRQATVFNNKVKPQISEDQEQSYVAIGNMVKVYSLKTGLMISVLRSKAAQSTKRSKNEDVHAGNIVAMVLIEQKLFTLCSKGILAEWDCHSKELLEAKQLDYDRESAGKIKLAAINQQHVVCFHAQSDTFNVYNTISRTQISSFTKASKQQAVTYLSLQKDTVVYIQNKHAQIVDLSTNKTRTIKREARLTVASIKLDGQLLALGDIYGKIYIVFLNSEKNVIQTLHWHAHPVSVLAFVEDSAYLLSGGREAVVVQWHLDKQDKTFVSRVGHSILNMQLTSNFYGLLLGDNSYKVVRFDNNKSVVNTSNINFDHAQQNGIASFDEYLVVPDADSSLQIFNSAQQHEAISRVQTRPRNYTCPSTNHQISRNSENDDQKETRNSRIDAFACTQHGETLVTVDTLMDSRGEVCSQNLKVYNKNGNNDFDLVQLFHDPCQDSTTEVKLTTLDESTFAFSNGHVLKIFECVKNKWVNVQTITYQDKQIKQLVPNIKLRLKLSSKQADSADDQSNPVCLVLLHEQGFISFWNQDTHQFEYAFAMNSDKIDKIIFEQSCRYMAGMTSEGSVEVWKLKTKDAKYHWSLNFNSVTQIESNPLKENQFFVLMNSQDVKSSSDSTETESKQDSVLLFQFSRPQNLIMYWKFIVPIRQMHFVSHSSQLMLINKNKEIQSIYCCLTQNDLKEVASKKQKTQLLTQKRLEDQIENDKKLDFDFTTKKQDTHDLNNVLDQHQRKTMMNLQEVQTQRLDKAQTVMKESEFTSMPSMSFCFDQLCKEMLFKPSKATTLVDLQTELAQQLTVDSNDQMTDNQFDQSNQATADLNWNYEAFMNHA